MTSNVGTIDRVLRLVIGAFLILAPLLNIVGLGANTIVAYVLMVVGGILALTAVFGTCPMYNLLGINTKSE